MVGAVSLFILSVGTPCSQRSQYEKLLGTQLVALETVSVRARWGLGELPGGRILGLGADGGDAIEDELLCDP